MEFDIGKKIKTLRKERKLTLQDVANETGFSPALISQIENNNVSPPIATLSKIARFFDVKMSFFFEEGEGATRYEIVRKDERRVVSRVISKDGTGHGYTYETLSYRKKNKNKTKFVELSRRYEFSISVITKFEILTGSNPNQSNFWDSLFRKFSHYLKKTLR